MTVVAVMLLLAMPCRAAGEPEQVEGLDELWQAALLGRWLNRREVRA